MESTIREQYYKMYKQLEQSAKRYKRMYDIDITLPRKLKYPKSKSVELLVEYKEKQQKLAREKAYWIRYWNDNRYILGRR